MERQQREPLGLRRLGLAAGPRRPPVGAGYYFDLLPASSPSSTRPAVLAGQPVLRRMAVAERRAHGCVHDWESGTGSTTPGTATTGPGSSPSSAAGPADVGDVPAAISDYPLTPTRPACCTTRRRTTATQAGGGSPLTRRPRHRRLAVGDPAQPGPRRHTGVEHFRSLRGRCMGTIGGSSTTVAGDELGRGRRDGRPKPAWYALRDAYAPRLLTIQPAARLALFAVNDTANDEWTVERVRPDGRFDGDRGRRRAGRPWRRSLVDRLVGAARRRRPRRATRPPRPSAVDRRPALRGGAGPSIASCANDPATSIRGELVTRQQHGRGLVAEITAATFVHDLHVEADRIEPGAPRARSPRDPDARRVGNADRSVGFGPRLAIGLGHRRRSPHRCGGRPTISPRRLTKHADQR